MNKNTIRNKASLGRNAYLSGPIKQSAASEYKGGGANATARVIRYY